MPTRLARGLRSPLVLGLLVLAGCSSEPGARPAGVAEGDTNLGPSIVPSDDCKVPEEGCACAEEGAAVPCGLKLAEEGGMTKCAVGELRCQGGNWSACQPGEEAVWVRPPEAPGLDMQGLGSSTKCVSNPCNPYCYNYQDTGGGLTFPSNSGLQQSQDPGGGVTLKPDPNGKPGVTLAGFRIAPKPSVTVKITSIPLGQYPVVDSSPQFTAEFLCGNPPAPCVPPKPTPANWTLSSYQNILINNDGLVSVIKPIPSTTTVIGKAGGYSDISQVNVVVDVPNGANAPQSVVTSFAVANQNPAALPTDNFSWLYPYKDTLFPRGLTAPVAQTDFGSLPGNVYVRYTLRHRNASNAIDFSWSKIELQSNPPRYTVPQHVWQFFDETASNGPAELVIQRATTTAPPSGCQDAAFNGRNYRFCSVGYDWTTARNQCQAMGMNLASPISSAENNFVGSVATNIAQGAWWIGYNDIAAEGNFVWSDGSPNVFSFWNGGEPNNVNNEDCAELLTGSYRWNDLPCSWGRYFICEGPQVASPITQVYKEVVLPIRFSSEPMQGTVYFWEVNNGRIAKILDDGTLVQNFLQSNGRCVACHSVSADGTTLVAQMDGGNGNGGTFNTQNGAFTYNRGGANQVMAVSPDGYWSIWGDWGYLSRSNSNYVATNQDYRSRVGATSGRLVTPAWSPDGKWIAWTRWDSGSWYVDFSSGNLFLTPFNDKRPETVNWQYFGSNTQITSANGTWDTYATPSFSPDSNYLIYQDANAIRTRGNLGRLWLMNRANTGQKVILSKANTPTTMAANGTTTAVPDQHEIAYEPTFSPAESGGYYWAVFISNRWYGNTIHPTWGVVKPGGGHLKDTGKKQMWVTAIPKNPNMAADPSSPPFWLPGQEFNNENMRGFFAKTPCKTANQSCKWDEDCCGYNNGTALCVLDQPVSPAATRHCGSFTPGQCVAQGQSCTDSSQCCQSPEAQECILGLCTVPQPLPFYSPTPFTRDYDSTCPQGTRVVWRFLSWKGLTPSDSAIEAFAQTGETLAEVAAASSSKLDLLPGAQCAAGYQCGDVDLALKKIPSSHKNKLRVTFMLLPSSGGTDPPTLLDWKQEYDCVPSE